jgi:hypothetical protein
MLTVGEANSATRGGIPQLVVIGAVAGLFSAVFGVGGGILVVPLLIVLAGYDTRAATATSLAAIIFVAVWGTVAHGALGNVEYDKALLVGVPAMLGVTVGVRLKPRLPTAVLTYLFAGLLVVVAVVLVLE